MKYLFAILLFFSFAGSAQDYTFQKTDCRLEILIGAQIRYSMQLEDITWTDRIGGIEVKDGVTSLSCNSVQIANYVSDQVDSLMLDLQTWRLACITRVSGDTLFIGSDTIITNDYKTGWASYTDDSLSAVSPQVVSAGDTAILINNYATVIDTYIPSTTDSLYGINGGGQFNIFGELGATYVIRIDFVAKVSAVNGYSKIIMDIGSDDNSPVIINSSTFPFPKGQNTDHTFSETYLVYALNTFEANGCKIKIVGGVGDISIHSVSYTIAKTTHPN